MDVKDAKSSWSSQVHSVYLFKNSSDIKSSIWTLGSNIVQYFFKILNVYDKHDNLKWSPSTSIKNTDRDDDIIMFLIQGNFVKIQAILKFEKIYVGINLDIFL